MQYYFSLEVSRSGNTELLHAELMCLEHSRENLHQLFNGSPIILDQIRGVRYLFFLKLKMKRSSE